MGLNTKERFHRCRGRRAQKSFSRTLGIFVLFCVNFGPVFRFSQRFVCFACEVTRLLIYLRFRERTWKAALTKNTNKGGRPKQKMISTKKVEMRNRLNFIVFFAGAAVRLPSRKRRRVTSQTQKKKSCANAKKGKISAQKKTKLHNVPENHFCTRRPRHRRNLS